MRSRLDKQTSLRTTQPLSRRDFLSRGLALGTVIVASSGLLAACGPFGDDDETPESELTPETAPNGTPEATPEDEDATPEPKEDTATPDPEATPTPAGPQEGGTMVIALAQDATSLHPDLEEVATNWMVTSQIHNALLELDHNFELEPVLAASHEIAEDGMSYTFSLQEGVHFHNGEELTSSDVQYTFDWYRDPENTTAKSLNYTRVEHIEAPDPYTVVVQMAQPDGTFLRWGATNFILASGYHARVGANEYGVNPIGTGPFTLQQWTRGQSITLEAFDDHFRDRPNLDSLQFSVIPDASARAAALQDGDADSAFNLTLEDSLGIEDDDEFTTIRVTDLDCNHFPLNNTHPVLSDRAVRRAMMHAINRQQMIDDLYQGAATLATSNLSPAVEYWYEPDVQEYDHAPERAVELLEEAGWVEGPDGIREREGQRLAFTCTTITGDETRRRQAEMAREMLAAAGIEMNLDEAPVGTILEAMRAAEMDASVFNWTYGGWDGEPDARTSLHSGGFNNFSQFHTSLIDTRLVIGVGEANDDARRRYYAEIQEIVADEVPFLYIMYRHSFYHFGPRVQELPDSALWGPRLYRMTRLLSIQE